MSDFLPLATGRKEEVQGEAWKKDSISPEKDDGWKEKVQESLQLLSFASY